MRSGRLRHRVAIEKAVSAQDQYGAEVVTWQQVAIRWASVDPLRGREWTQAQQEMAENMVRIKLRASDDIAEINPRWRLAFDNIYYDIKSVADVRSVGREYEIMATERRADLEVPVVQKALTTAEDGTTWLTTDSADSFGLTDYA